MDDGGHRENGRQKPLQGQWLMQQREPMKHVMSIIAERDAAIQERNLAFSEKKAALAERDLALLQRDSAMAERNKAMIERDKAIATLQYRDNTMSTAMSQCSPGCHIAPEVKHIHHPQQQAHDPCHVLISGYHSCEVHVNDPVNTIAAVAAEPPKALRGKRGKESKPVTAAAASRKSSKSSKRVKQEADDIGQWKIDNRQVESSKHDWKEQDLGLNQVSYDETTMPVPVCSCTGVLRPCYKWGNGGWQSSCCTSSLSMYPLPAVPNRRHARVGGRKMCGSAFNKLLSRLAADGHDLSISVDLKPHWAKHGTNRYITIK